MNRQRLVRAALWAYPPSGREELGAEMEGTILDAGPTRRATFARELFDLTRFGLATRATGVAGAGTARVLADGVCCGATWIMMLDISTMAVWRLQRAPGSALTQWWSIVVITIMLALALYGFDRIAGIGALAWMFARIPELAGVTAPAQWLPPAVLVVACFLVLVLYPRQRGRDVRRLGWLAVPVWVFATLGASDRGGGVSAIVLLLVVLTVAGAAIASLPTDPRLAIAATLPISYVGLGVAHRGDPITFVLAAAAPIVLCLAAVRSYRLRTRAPI